MGGKNTGNMNSGQQQLFGIYNSLGCLPYAGEG